MQRLNKLFKLFVFVLIFVLVAIGCEKKSKKPENNEAWERFRNMVPAGVLANANSALVGYIQQLREGYAGKDTRPKFIRVDIESVAQFIELSFDKGVNDVLKDEDADKEETLVSLKKADIALGARAAMADRIDQYAYDHFPLFYFWKHGIFIGYDGGFLYGKINGNKPITYFVACLIGEKWYLLVLGSDYESV